MGLARGTAHWVLTPLILGTGLTLLPRGLDLAAPQWIASAGLGLVALALALAWFFRDPPRSVAEGVAAAADGRVTIVDTVEGRRRVATFMNLHDVHVNRTPLDGVVREVTHAPGGKLPAFHKDSERNERVIIELDTAAGPVTVVQIAGAVARRIVPYVAPGEKVKKGDRLGIIRLGSRVDLHLPPELPVSVAVGDRVRAGETTVARWEP